jgi:hypothetical protein
MLQYQAVHVLRARYVLIINKVIPLTTSAIKKIQVENKQTNTNNNNDNNNNTTIVVMKMVISHPIHELQMDATMFFVYVPERYKFVYDFCDRSLSRNRTNPIVCCYYRHATIDQMTLNLPNMKALIELLLHTITTIIPLRCCKILCRFISVNTFNPFSP